ncbi:hypothetical protein INR49_013134 [Caranx melampygus]|nr:hypothetical protein INR49_013134 [Caranx melampygus]
MTSTAKEAVASTASGLAPSTGFTSTRSMADSRPAHQHIHKVKPPFTGVPVAGARDGSKASMSKLKWIGRCFLFKTLFEHESHRLAVEVS